MPIFVSTTPQGYTLALDIFLAGQSVANNTSTIEWELRLSGPGSTHNDWATTPSSWSVDIDGQKSSGTKAYDFRNYDVLVLGNGTKTITHKVDGTKTIITTGTFNDAASGVGDDTVSDDVVLTPIPRTSNPTLSAASVAAGSTITITTNRASASFTHDITYKFGSATGTIANDVGVSTTWTPPLSLLSQIPNSTSGSATITTKTYNGASLIGTATDTVTITAPSSVVPTIGGITRTETVTNVSTNVGAFVQNQSKLSLAITGAAGAYGSTISAYKITVAGQTINAASGTTGVINAKGTVPIVATVTDSRGRTGTFTQNITVLAWAPPVITALTAQRATSTGVVAENGTYIRVNINAAVQSLINSTEKNTLTLAILTRLRGATAWTSKYAATLQTGIAYNNYILLSSYPIEDSYEVLVNVTDRFATSSGQTTVATSSVFMDWADGGLGVGKFHEQGALDVGGPIYEKGFPVAVPAGVILPFGGGTVPAGYSLCDGGALTTTAQPALFAAIGYGYGGSGTSFNKPNLKGRIPVGRDAAQTEFDVLGESGGAKTVAHSHALSDLGFALFTAQGANPLIRMRRITVPTWSPSVHVNATGSAAGTAADTTTAAGLSGTTDSTTAANLQPYVVVNYIIKL